MIEAKRVFDAPTPEDLRRFTEEMPNCRLTEFGNVNVQTRVTSRSAGSTYVVSDDPSVSSGKTMTREEYERIARMQDEYIRGQEMVVVDGYIGNVEDFRTRARLSIERANANIAGMQQKLYYPRENGEPEVQVIYTPNLPAPGYPDDRVIAVDLEKGVTRVLNSDYFGESKKGGLRMWNNIVFERGGLALHAGCKVIPVDGRARTMLIVG
ncbi:MAG TPA: phosphoenolpyruvate carboxykinase (ATP), partial [Actinomycetota bacterium]|nr:phosphoenolpyruvate carboxykinase (ATP) [Actinomycetota bacterium]